MQLDKLLQSQGFGSRKYCQQLIQKGHVKIAGQTLLDHKMKCDVSALNFSVFGEDYVYHEKVYLALHKPKHYECSHQPQQHHSVFSLLPEHLLARHIQTIGRLDQDTTGLLLCTDDGQYLHQLTHPKKHVEKYYVVTTADPITTEQMQQLQQGVTLKGEQQLFIAEDFQQLAENQCRFAVRQGVYHQIKRMLAAIGHFVVALHRDQIGTLQLQQLALSEGQWCYLTPDQYQAALSRAEII